MHFILNLILGALSGFIAGKIMDSKGGLLRNIIVGIVGSSLGGWIAGLLGIHSTGLGGILVSVAGACLLIWIARKLFH